MRHLIPFAFLFAVAAYAVEPTTVILVRHGEKVAETMSGDPRLAPAGEARAKELARVLADAGVAAIYTTSYHRTRDTITPLATDLGLSPIVIPTGKTYAADLVARIRAENAGQIVLVVGHSNTLPDVIRELGIMEPPSINDSQYDDLFVVTIAGATPHLLRLRYGAVSR